MDKKALMALLDRLTEAGPQPQFSPGECMTSRAFRDVVLQAYHCGQFGTDLAAICTLVSYGMDLGYTLGKAELAAVLAPVEVVDNASKVN